LNNHIKDILKKNEDKQFWSILLQMLDYDVNHWISPQILYKMIHPDVLDESEVALLWKEVSDLKQEIFFLKQ